MYAVQQADTGTTHPYMVASKDNEPKLLLHQQPILCAVDPSMGLLSFQPLTGCWREGIQYCSCLAPQSLELG